MKAFIIDTTLRDGEQAPGVVFSLKEKVKIAAMLDQLGVDEVEAGTPSIGKQEREAIQTISQSGFKFRTSSWCRATIDDLKLASELGTNSVNISLPVSDIQIKNIGKSKKWVLETLKMVVEYAVNHFEFVTVGAQDASRANINFLREFIFYADENNASRIRINDTVGILDPIETKSLIGDLTWYFPKIEFEFHGHNDFGMATANTITALKSGAKCVSATINGLGERAGNSTLEEIIAYLTVNNKSKRYNTALLNELSNYVAEVSGNILADNKPITGNKTFLHESGIHTAAMVRNKKTYQVINPEDFGNTTFGFVFGKHSGSAAISHFFIQHGIQLDKHTQDLLLSTVKSFTQLTKKAVNNEMLMGFYKHMTELRNTSDI